MQFINNSIKTILQKQYPSLSFSAMKYKLRRGNYKNVYHVY